MRTKPLDWTALSFIIAGALNWALVGLFRFDLVAALFGGVDSWLSRVLYVLIGLSGLYCLTFYSRLRVTDHGMAINRD